MRPKPHPNMNTGSGRALAANDSEKPKKSTVIGALT